jgi:hypothetical protein
MIPDLTPPTHYLQQNPIMNPKTKDICHWAEGYNVVWSGDTNLAVGGKPSFPIPKTAPGQERIISIPMVAPEKPGEYRSTWILRTDKGVKFGDPFWVIIVVQ